MEPSGCSTFGTYPPIFRLHPAMEHILNDPVFQEKLLQYAEESGELPSRVERNAKKYLKEMYSEHKPVTELIAARGAEYILGRGYDQNIDINPVEIKELQKLMSRHPVAFVMTHKTYLDMLVLGLVLVRHGLPIPYTFGGINMSFLGLGQLGRKSGVIFIRRSFKDNELYKMTLRHYISSLVDEQGHFMWAIEGTRSRTGKLVWPKMGVLKYIHEADLDSKHEVKYVPVSIVYDLIPDVKDMTEEGRNQKKQAESLAWALNYVRKMGDDFGRISLRIGEAVDAPEKITDTLAVPEKIDTTISPYAQEGIPKFAFKLIHQINRITPVTTASLICTALLSKFSQTKAGIESDVADLMELVESHKTDALVDRGAPIGERVQEALGLLTRSGIVRQQGDGLHARFALETDEYLPAVYYANMAVHHLYHRAFIELAWIWVSERPARKRYLDFWSRVMELRDLFKFEFFYSPKAEFSDELEADLNFLEPGWNDILKSTESPKQEILAVLERQRLLVAPAVLHTYTEAYCVVCHAALAWEKTHQNIEFSDKDFLESCFSMGAELQWQGRIRRIRSVSRPFLLNGIRLLRNRGLLPGEAGWNEAELEELLSDLEGIDTTINQLQGITLQREEDLHPISQLSRNMVPGSTTEGITKEILEGERGAHIAAYFDLDRTLIAGFSAVEFFQTRLLSGKMTAREVIAQFAGVIVYATGNANFAALASVGAKGVKGIDEQVFMEVGEEVYSKHLADAIYPESRALVAAHMAMGHTVAIVSAATPYQVEPIARDLGIEHVMCTRMEVKDGVFTGNIEEPACWGEGKAIAGRTFAEPRDIDLSKSYFYTDSAEDMPLMEIVGNPRPINPDTRLAARAFEEEWPIYHFDQSDRLSLTNVVRTGLAVGSLVPAAMTGLAAGVRNLSWKDGVNTMMAAVGDIGTSMAGIRLVVKGEENLWSQRPAVFIFNHQSRADFFIGAKLVRKDAVGVAKKELKVSPIGPLMVAAGMIFVDRLNREKAIEALKPAVDALQNGTSIIIAPEGTRSYDYNLGRFKKGAFHLAMQAGVPIVPIVIKNAHDVMPRGSNLFSPSAVEVVVLEPVDTSGWDTERLDDHVREVRNLYLAELGQPLDESMES